MFCNSHKKMPVLESFSLKLQAFRPATLLKRDFQHRRFSVNIMKFLRTRFSQNTSRRLLLSRGSKVLWIGNLWWKDNKECFKIFFHSGFFSLFQWWLLIFFYIFGLKKDHFLGKNTDDCFIILKNLRAGLT